MEKTKAATNLGRAERLAASTKATAARWYVRYLIIYGIASFVLAASYGLIDDAQLATLITMPFWAIVIIGLAVWSARQRTAIRGFGIVHGAVIGTWAAAWAVTIGLGTTMFAGVWQWFVGGGTVLAAVAFAGAYVTHRRGRKSESRR